MCKAIQKKDSYSNLYVKNLTDNKKFRKTVKVFSQTKQIILKISHWLKTTK